MFKLQFVQKHLDRFKGEEQRRNLKQSTSISRRKQLLDAQPGPGYSEVRPQQGAREAPAARGVVGGRLGAMRPAALKADTGAARAYSWSAPCK